MSFILHALFRPQSTGALAPSSKRLARLIVGRAKLAQARVVAELGPGTGSFTGEILGALRPDAAFFTLELNPAFADMVRARYPRVNTITGSAAELGLHLKALGHAECDRVICGLPWTAFPPDLQASILGDIVGALAPGGLFLTFAYAPLHHLPRGRSFRRLLEQKFASVTLTETVLNLPPAFVYVCRK